MHDLEPLQEQTPIVSEKTGLLQGIGRVAAAWKHETFDSNHTARKLGASALVTAVQIPDRFRLAAVVVPEVATRVLEKTNSPILASVAGGATFGAWCFGVGLASTAALFQYPNTVSKFEEKFPKFVGFFEDSLPGYKTKKDADSDEDEPEQSVSLITRIKRGFNVVGIGTIAYVGTAAAQGEKQGDVHKLNAESSLDGGAAVGAVVLGVTSGLTWYAEKNPELAQDIQDVISDSRLWLGVAVVLMATSWLDNRKRRKERETLLLETEAQPALEVE